MNNTLNFEEWYECYEIELNNIFDIFYNKLLLKNKNFIPSKNIIYNNFIHFIYNHSSKDKFLHTNYYD